MCAETNAGLVRQWIELAQKGLKQGQDKQNLWKQTKESAFICQARKLSNT
jgi:hypothetical protein